MEQINIKTRMFAPIQTVWECWTDPKHIRQWNTASEDWHTTDAQVDLRPGGAFTSRMEAKDGSMGIDFSGTYSRVDPPFLIESDLNGRALRVEFIEGPEGVIVRETFDPETQHPVEAQRDGWQAILDNFKRHVEAVAVATS